MSPALKLLGGAVLGAGLGAFVPVPAADPPSAVVASPAPPRPPTRHRTIAAIPWANDVAPGITGVSFVVAAASSNAEEARRLTRMKSWANTAGASTAAAMAKLSTAPAP